MRLQRNWKPRELLEGMKNDAAAMANSAGGSQKIKREMPYDPVILILRVIFAHSCSLQHYSQ